MGILEPNYGSISVDGVLINQLQEPWWRKNIIYLPQEIEFIDGSFRVNIFGDMKLIQPKEINQILFESGIKEYIDDQQNGIEAILTSTGKELSPGIRKKIAIARALTSKGKIVILDEPTESLDQLGSSQVYKLINKLHKENKTIIICSSDPYIINGASAILNLNPKTGAAIYTPKQLADYQKNIMEKRKKYFRQNMKQNKIQPKDSLNYKKNLN
tara:strand:- start:214 stop:855 length:642 start_codon:yes stop_codon:yes gene_type:complete